MKNLSRNKLQVWLFSKLLRFAAALQNIPAKVTPPPFRLMQIGSLFWQSRALYVATKLGLADVLGDAEKSTTDIAVALHLHEGHLYRLMRMLGAMAIFEETAPRTFRNSKTSAYLREDNPKNVRAMVLMHNSPEMTNPWIDFLEEGVRDGGVPFAKANGIDLFAYMDQNKGFDTLFSRAMDAVENLTGDAYLKDFNWGAFDRIVDVGGSKGSKAISILKSNKHLRAVVFDRPQIIETARDYWHGRLPDSVQARLEFSPGDMFEGVPAAESAKDIYLCFAIFHGLSDTESLQLLKNLKAAIGREKACVLIGDAVAEETNIDSTIASFDMQMLIGTKGRERTASEWRRLIDEAGFVLVEIVDVRTFAKFIVIKPV